MQGHYGAGRTRQACPPPSSFSRDAVNLDVTPRAALLTFYWLLSRRLLLSISKQWLSSLWKPIWTLKTFRFLSLVLFLQHHVIPAPHLLAFPRCWERAENALVFPWEWWSSGRCVRALVCTFAPLNVSLSTGPCPALASAAPKTILDLINVCR